MLIRLRMAMFSLTIAHMIPKQAHHLSVVLHGFLASDPIIDGPMLVDQLIILIMIHLVQMLISK